ncbi:alpha/beta hydrolase [Streptomyces sp. NPDC058653]|uniref:alpha/beta hydrolase n=1 Tax=Streptomyces sp. NPDC058653 TaxID=3346576 RepID=UPI00366102B2
MPRRDPRITRRAAFQARRMQALSRVFMPLLFSSARLRFATEPTARPTTATIPTRHGPIRTLVYAPPARRIARHEAAGSRPPVHLILHGGAFIVRLPQQEDNVARYLASEVGCYVVLPDYDTAPRVRFPVAEEQAYDAYRWVREHAEHQGWDRDAVSVGGGSAGGKLALNVALLAIDDNYHRPAAVSAEYPVLDLTREDATRVSVRKRPMVSPSMMSLMRRTYFADTDLSSPLASPALHPRRGELPPTLVLTGEHDTLCREADDFARDLAAAGVDVTHHEFPGADHAFTHTKPVETAEAAIRMIGEHLSRAFAGTAATEDCSDAPG